MIVRFRLVLFMSCFTLVFLHAQEVQEKFYEDRYKSKQALKLKAAKYKEIKSISKDSVELTRLYRIRRKKLILVEEIQMKNGNQVGIWKFFDKRGKLETTMDYTAELKYLDRKFDSPNYFSFNRKEIISAKDSMTPPKLLGNKSVFFCIYGTLHYPAYARENNIQGEVVFNARIAKTGALEILGILKSSHPILEKPAWIALSNCSNWIPAAIDGLAVDSYFVLPVKFRLE